MLGRSCWTVELKMDRSITVFLSHFVKLRTKQINQIHNFSDHLFQFRRLTMGDTLNHA